MIVKTISKELLQYIIDYFHENYPTSGYESILDVDDMCLTCEHFNDTMSYTHSFEYDLTLDEMYDKILQIEQEILNVGKI